MSPTTWRPSAGAAQQVAPASFRSPCALELLGQNLPLALPVLSSSGSCKSCQAVLTRTTSAHRVARHVHASSATAPALEPPLLHLQHHQQRHPAPLSSSNWCLWATRNRSSSPFGQFPAPRALAPAGHPYKSVLVEITWLRRLLASLTLTTRFGVCGASETTGFQTSWFPMGFGRGGCSGRGQL